MVYLSILNDFCSWWWFWWIVPFLLGLALGAAIWGRYKSKVAELESINERYKSSIYDMEAKANKLRSDNEKCKSELESAMHRNKSLQQETNQLKKAVPKQSLGTSDAIVSDRKNLSEASAIGAIGLDGETKKKDGKNKIPYGALEPANLQIIEGIGPKIETILKASNITSWQVLAKKSKGELRAILEKQGARYSIIDPSDWPLQAHRAAKGDWEGLLKLQSEDGSDAKLSRIMKRLNLL